jgi:hypothetical protein
MTEAVRGRSTFMRSSLAKPLGRLDIVLWDALATFVHRSEFKLGSGKSLLSRLAIPIRRLGIILRDAKASVTHNREVVLSTGVPLLGQRRP